MDRSTIRSFTDRHRRTSLLKRSPIAIFVSCLIVFIRLSTAVATEDDTGNENVSKAERLFREGHILLKERRFDESCSRFAASQRADPASGTLLALAYCEEQAGRLASAWRTYQEAAELAEKEHHEERHDAATTRAGVLLPRLSTLTLIVPEPEAQEANLVVRKDGDLIDPILWGTPVPVDGGRHFIVASASGHKEWRLTIVMRNEGDHQTITIARLEPERSTQPPVVPAPPPRDESTQQARRAAPAEHPSATALTRTAWVLGAASIAAFGVGAVLAVAANSKNNRSYDNDHCDARGCDERGVELRNEALSMARLATLSVVAGGLLTASSVTLFVVADSRSSGKAMKSWSAPLSAQPVGVCFSGRF